MLRKISHVFSDFKPHFIRKYFIYLQIISFSKSETRFSKETSEKKLLLFSVCLFGATTEKKIINQTKKYRKTVKAIIKCMTAIRKKENEIANGFANV